MERSAELECSARPPRTNRRSLRRAGLFAALVLTAGCAAQVEGVDQAIEDGGPALGVHAEALCSGSNVTLNVSPASPQPAGMFVTLTAQASCGGTVPVEYEFSYRLSTSATWTRLRSWSTNRVFGWNTTGIAPATYSVRVAAREQGTTSVANRVITYQLSAPATSQCPGASLIRDVPYGAHAMQKLDLHVAPSSTPRPLLVVIHGGGWTSGDKAPFGNDLISRICPLVSDGYALAAINYRLTCIPSTCPSGDPVSCEDHIFPEQIHDAKAAVRFLRANAAGYGFDPNRIYSWGFSAGGHLSALLGTSGGVAALEDLTIGNAGVSSSVKGFIDCSGPIRLETMDAELGVSGRHDAPCSPESQLIGCEQGLQTNCPQSKLAQVSPLTYVDATDPPALIGHGEDDPNVPRQQSYHLRDALTAAGVRVTYREAVDQVHTVKACPTISDMRQFLSSIP